MSTTHEKIENYNGWKNYETWHTSLMLNNSAETQDTWLTAAREVWVRSEAGEIFSRSEQGRFHLADQLKNQLESMIPEAGSMTDLHEDYEHLLLGLMRAGFDEVEWDEVADGFLSGAECEGYEPAVFAWRENG